MFNADNYPYKAYSLNNFRKIPQVKAHLSEDQMKSVEVVGSVLPFKVNSYVINELINWEKIPDDPIFKLTFPQRNMLNEEHFQRMEKILVSGKKKHEMVKVANDIRQLLNPHPAGQMELNVPKIEGTKLTGIQHKYRETILFFPGHSQTCHAYCTFCFRWPQFVGIDELKFAMRETELMVKYLKAHEEVTDVLFTGGDPLIMTADRLESYLLPLIENDLPHIKNIRLGTKALGYWPYKFTSDRDCDDIIRLFSKIVDSGKSLAFMAHFNHPVELQTDVAQQAVKRILSTGAQIRSQSPVMKNINDSANTWRDMWEEQVRMGIIPYYMFLARDTGAQHYFAVPLVKAHQIYQEAFSQVSGLARTVRGPSMSAEPGKVHVLGSSTINGQKVMVLKFIQSRVPEWTDNIFFAKYDKNAIWLDDLKPAFGAREFFFERAFRSFFADAKELTEDYFK